MTILLSSFRRDLPGKTRFSGRDHTREKKGKFGGGAGMTTFPCNLLMT